MTLNEKSLLQFMTMLALSIYIHLFFNTPGFFSIFLTGLCVVNTEDLQYLLFPPSKNHFTLAPGGY